MKRIVWTGLLFLMLGLVGVLPAASDDSSGARQRGDGKPSRHVRAAIKQLASPRSYRSPGATHKLMIPAGEAPALEARRRSQRYDSFTIVEVSNAELQSLGRKGAMSRFSLRDDLNLILLRSGQIDTTGPEPEVPADLRQPNFSKRSLHLVQLFGPPTPETLGALESTGVNIISYIPNNAYLVWARSSELRQLRDIRRRSDLIQWDGPFHPAYKLDRRIKTGSLEQIPASIQIVDSPDAQATIEAVKAISRDVLMSEFRAAGAVHIKILTESIKLVELARRPDVILIEPWPEVKLNDERANQIVAGAISQETVNSRLVAQPTAPGYLPFLNTLGFVSNFNFAVDVGDTGLDSGLMGPDQVHPDFLDATGASRIAYLHDYTSDPDTAAPAHDGRGHGTLNASIVAGFSDRTTGQFADPQGFRYGLGVAPFARIGGSKLFDDSGRFRLAGSLGRFIFDAYGAGARVSTNSWGSCDTLNGFCNLYADDSVIFDSLVRDADPSTPGNQGMTIVFSSGNEGEEGVGTIGIPATAKNVITVGASENFRATAPDGTEARDGCGVGASEADNALDIVAFSSFGPSTDGRTKPDLVAPGTHVQGAASLHPAFRGQAVCGARDGAYFPPGQTLYTWSSGTSHSTPVVAGAAALAFQWLRDEVGAEPSPALIKGFLLNSTRYLSGRFAADDLPGAHQGWGLLDIDRAFKATDRIILDEDPIRTFTQSGGGPFEVTGVISDPSQEIRVMLVWTDPPGNPATNAPYVNRLNLEVIVNGILYKGNNFDGQYSVAGGIEDIFNNVQGVRLAPGTTGSFAIRVQPVLIAGDGVPGNGVGLDQDFALVVTNGRETAVPVLSVDGVAVQHSGGATDGSLLPGERAKVSIAVGNDSHTAGAEITAAALVIFSGDGGAGPAVIGTYPTIQPDESRSNDVPFEIQVPADLRCGSLARLELRLTTPFGDFVLPVRIRTGRQLQTLQPIVLLDDDVDSERVRWKLKKGFSVKTGLAHSGTRAYNAVDPGSDENDVQLSTLLMKKAVQIPSDAGNVRLSFFHVFNLEPGYDGGVLEISTDGGETWQDLGSRAIVGGYDGTVTSTSKNPLGSRVSWTARGRAGVFSQVVIDLDEFAGRKIRLRFLAGFDEAVGVADGFAGWFIDDIRITTDSFTCGALPGASDIEAGHAAGRMVAAPRQIPRAARSANRN